MAQVLVRNLSDDVAARLKQRAERHDRSLESELRDILTKAARDDREQIIRRLEAFRRQQMKVEGPSSLDLLRADRARDR